MFFIPKYLLILVLTILIDYFAAIMIEQGKGQKKKIWLYLSVTSTCLILAIFKYYNFLSENLSVLARSLGWNYSLEALGIILPIGLSFHTFQSLSYVVEVYRGNQKAERHFGIYSLYVMFYPQLIAGPIERPQNLLCQFREKQSFSYKEATNGLKLMAWGLFKKAVIADRFALLVDSVYGYPSSFDGVALIIATIFFAIQIYCDFSGYSDIAIGAAQVMGFKLMRNFERPYFSKSISEFWRRWHISLSTWFKDYVYIPLGGRHSSRSRWYFNLAFTFLLSGLWHGANWTYVIWGAINGFYLIFAIWFEKPKQYIADLFGGDKAGILFKLFNACTTFLLICFSWIFFRAKTVGEALYIASHLFDGLLEVVRNVIRSRSVFGLKLVQGFGFSYFGPCILLLGILFTVEMCQRHGSIRAALDRKPWQIRWTLYYGLVFALFSFGVFGRNEFIYFQF